MNGSNLFLLNFPHLIVNIRLDYAFTKFIFKTNKSFFLHKNFFLRRILLKSDNKNNRQISPIKATRQRLYYLNSSKISIFWPMALIKV